MYAFNVKDVQVGKCFVTVLSIIKNSELFRTFQEKKLYQIEFSVHSTSKVKSKNSDELVSKQTTLIKRK